MQKIDIKIIPSYWLISLFLAMWVGSFVIIFFLPVTVGFKLMLLAVTASYGGWLFWRDGLLLSRASITHISCQDGVWLLQVGSNQLLVTLLGESTVTTLVSVLRFHPQGSSKKLSCVIFPDSVGWKNYKDLMVKINTDPGCRT